MFDGIQDNPKHHFLRIGILDAIQIGLQAYKKTSDPGTLTVLKKIINDYETYTGRKLDCVDPVLRQEDARIGEV